MVPSETVNPGGILMEVLDLLAEDGGLAELTVMELPAGTINPMSAAALSLSKAAWTLKEKNGTATWRDLEAVAANYHRALDPDSPDLRESLLQHIGTLTAMVMSLDRGRAAGG